MFLKKPLLAVLWLMAACGEGMDLTQTGNGPAFSDSVQAADIWLWVSYQPYLLEYPDIGEITTQTIQCPKGGTATIELDNGPLAVARNVAITYTDCGFFHAGIGGDVFQNGNVNSTLNVLSTDVSHTFTEQHVSYSGVVGFSSDCDIEYFVTESGTEFDVKSVCTYQDSAGDEFRISGLDWDVIEELI